MRTGTGALRTSWGLVKSLTHMLADARDAKTAQEEHFDNKARARNCSRVSNFLGLAALSNYAAHGQ